MRAKMLSAGSVIILAALAAACAPKKPAPSTSTTAPVAAAEAGADRTNAEQVAQLRAAFARVEMRPDTSFLSAEDKDVLNLLIGAADDMSKIYLRQAADDNPATRAAIAASTSPDKQALLDLFDLHFGPWNRIDDNRPFYGDTPRPAGGGFYPVDMTKDEFEAWIAAHKEDEAAFRSAYTVIRRDGDKLVAIPYSKYYAPELKDAAEKLRAAAAKTKNPRLKAFLAARAEAFLSDDYFKSELAWMDLDGPIEVAIGPYETYTDGLFGYKAAFEAFVTVKSPTESAALAKYKDDLRDMEKNLPVSDKYKNFTRGFASPIVVADEIHGGGDNAAGVQTIAFNLPNDERVREAKGAKKVLLSNVMDAKFERILAPMADNVLVADQAKLLLKKYMGLETLFHELSHSMGPGTIVVDGRKTTVDAELKDLHSAMEEGKADVLGAYNILFLMKRGELPVAEKNEFLATYFVGLFRAMRFGVGDAHGRGAAFQYSYFRRAGAVAWDPAERRFRIDFAKLETAIGGLVHDVIVLQGDGDYAGAKRFLETTALLDEDASAVVATLAGLPVDIQPIYPEHI